MKILTMCQGGNCRSVALGWILKDHLKQDVIACGWDRNSQETIDMLCQWAHRIIVMQTEFIDKVPAAYRHKVSVYDVGPDRWFQIHPELISILQSMTQQDPNFRSVA